MVVTDSERAAVLQAKGLRAVPALSRSTAAQATAHVEGLIPSQFLLTAIVFSLVTAVAKESGRAV